MCQSIWSLNTLPTPPPLPKQLTGILLLSVLVGGGFEPYLAEVGDLNWKCQVFLVEYKYFT